MIGFNVDSWREKNKMFNHMEQNHNPFHFYFPDNTVACILYDGFSLSLLRLTDAELKVHLLICF